MEKQATSSAENSYVRVSTSEAGGTYAVGEIVVCPAEVIRTLGNGDVGDDYKVSRTWTFRKGKLIFTLYDWKSTDLYEPGLFSPQEFWKSEYPIDLHIGSKEPATVKDVAEFSAYLLAVISANPVPHIRP